MQAVEANSQALLPSQPIEEKCESCNGTGHMHDGPPWEDYNPVTCDDCGGSGTIHRDYLKEAFLIVQGRSHKLPERKHLEAIVTHCRQITSAAMALPQVKEAA